jgi:hypothetical protein
MSIQLDPQVHIDVEWIVAPDLESEWQHIDGCVAPQPVELQPIDDEDEWWPGRCIP